MTVKYTVLLAEVVLDSTNNVLRLTENASTNSATITAGSYFLRGDGASDDLSSALLTAMQNAGASTNTYSRTLVLQTSASSSSATLTVTRATGSDAFSMLWANASTTIDEGMFGFANSDTTSGSSAASTLSPACIWTSDQPVAASDPSFEGIGSQSVMIGGQVRTFDRGGPYSTRALTHEFIAPAKTLQSAISADANRSFEAFWSTVRDGRRIEVHEVAVDGSGQVTDTLGASTLVGTFVLDEASIRSFRPQRLEPGLELYSWGLGLRKYVA